MAEVPKWSVKMKCKIFDDNGVGTNIEYTINSWLETQPSVEIIKVDVCNYAENMYTPWSGNDQYGNWITEQKLTGVDNRTKVIIFYHDKNDKLNEIEKL